MAAESIRNLNEIRRLSIGGSELTDRGMAMLCELVSLRQLILVNAVSVTDHGFHDGWRLANLSDLELHAA